MYKKIIKEAVSELNILVIDESDNSKIFLTESISHFFNSTTYLSNLNDTLATYKQGKYDIVWFNIDELEEYGLDVVNEIRNDNEMQPIVVFTAENKYYYNILSDLINLNIHGFINAGITSRNELYKLLSSVCTKIYNRQLFMHYVEELENFQNDISKINNIHSEESQSEDDDFIFFPDIPFETKEEQSTDESIYEDYFSYLLLDDKEELIDLMNDMDAAMMDAFNGSENSISSIYKVGSIFVRFGNILMRYQFFSDIGSAIIELGNSLESNVNEVKSKADTLNMLISGFCSGLNTFISEVWETESNNPKFFNDSIINDLSLIMEMIIAPISTQNQSADNGDDLMFF